MRYHRNHRNLGLTRNFNRVFELSRGRYFKWTAHDDWHPPQTLRACAEVLEGDPTAVLCQPAVAIMDADGEVFDDWHPSTDLTMPSPQVRFHRLIWTLGEPHGLFGVMRSSALRRTRLIARLPRDRPGAAGRADPVGPIRQLPEVMHRYRAPRLLAGPAAPGPSRPAALGDPRPGQPRPAAVRTWRLVYEHLGVVARSGLAPRHKAWLMGDVVTRYGTRDSRRLAAEIYHSGRVLVSRAT